RAAGRIVACHSLNTITDEEMPARPARLRGGRVSGPSDTLPDVRVLLATDATWLVDAVVAALDDGETSFTVCSEGREVSKQLKQGAKAGDAPYDIAIVDLQIGSMG